MNKQIELFKAGNPNVRVYILPDQYDGVTVVWPYKSGFSSLTNDGRICEHFVSTDWKEYGKVVYPNPLDSEGYKHLGKKSKWDDLPESVKQSILYLFPLIWDIHPGHAHKFQLMYRIMYDGGDKDYFVVSVTNTVNFGTYEEAKTFYSPGDAQDYYKTFPDEFVGMRFEWRLVFDIDLFE